jgi:hypothetical protein
VTAQLSTAALPAVVFPPQFGPHGKEREVRCPVHGSWLLPADAADAIRARLLEHIACRRDGGPARRPRPKSRREPRVVVVVAAAVAAVEPAGDDAGGRAAPSHQGGSFGPAPWPSRDRRRAFGFRA